MRFTHTAPCLGTFRICVHKSKQLSIWLVVDSVTRCQHRRSLRTKTCPKRNIARGDETPLTWKTILLAFHDAVRHWKIYTVCAVMYINFLFSPSDENMTDMSVLTNAKAIYLNECTKLFMYSICTWWIPKNLNTWDIKSSVRVMSHFLHPSSVWEQEVEMDKKNRPKRATHLLFFLFSPRKHEKVSVYRTHVTLLAEAITRRYADSCWGRSSDGGVGRRSWKRRGEQEGCKSAEEGSWWKKLMKHFLDDYLPGSSVSRHPFPHFCSSIFAEKLAHAFVICWASILIVESVRF